MTNQKTPPHHAKLVFDANRSAASTKASAEYKACCDRAQAAITIAANLLSAAHTAYSSSCSKANAEQDRGFEILMVAVGFDQACEDARLPILHAHKRRVELESKAPENIRSEITSSPEQNRK